MIKNIRKRFLSASLPGGTFKMMPKLSSCVPVPTNSITLEICVMWKIETSTIASAHRLSWLCYLLWILGGAWQV